MGQPQRGARLGVASLPSEPAAVGELEAGPGQRPARQVVAKRVEVQGLRLVVVGQDRPGIAQVYMEEGRGRDLGGLLDHGDDGTGVVAPAGRTAVSARLIMAANSSRWW